MTFPILYRRAVISSSAAPEWRRQTFGTAAERFVSRDDLSADGYCYLGGKFYESRVSVCEMIEMNGPWGKYIMRSEVTQGQETSSETF